MPVGEGLLTRLERAKALDPWSDRIAAVLRKAVRPGPVEDTLSGKQLGHPVHPAAAAVPIGAWVCAHALDAVDDPAAATAQLVGIISALPTAATGASDWLHTAGAERRVGLVHAGLNYTGLTLHVASWWCRRRGRTTSAKALALAGTGVVGAAGWLGGHLAYALGVGVDTTAFQKFPPEWTDALALQDVPDVGTTHAEVAGVPVLFAKVAGQVVAYADRCTHRGAPLHEGDVTDGCVHCPWHDSVFDLADGSVRSGPATRPQPKLEVEVHDDRVRVRRVDERSLRTNPVGH